MKRRLEDLERYDKILFRLGLFLKGSLCAWPVARITNTGALAESRRRRSPPQVHLQEKGSPPLGALGEKGVGWK